MITIFKKTLLDKTLKKQKDFKVGSWIDIENPSPDELETAAEKFKLDIGLLKDALDPYEVPRLESDEGTVYIYVRVPTILDSRIATVPVLLISGPDFLATVSSQPLPFLERFSTGKVNFTTTQKTRLLLQIFNEINMAYSNFLNQINKDVRSQTVEFEKISNASIMQFVHFESVLNDFIASLIPMNADLQKLLSGKILTLFENDKDITEDLVLGSGQLIEQSKSALRTITNTRDAYSTIMTNNLNRVIKLFTSLTVLLTIPTMIASIYGMNVALPFQHTTHAFSIIISIITVITGILTILFLKNKWL